MSGCISRRVEIELNAGSSSTDAPLPASSTPSESARPCQDQ